ncbi:MAG: flagellar basal body protein [Planctomycetota bacterium]
MISGELNDVGRLLDVAGLRHRTIAANLANANTPGYLRREVRFEESFAKALEQGTNPGAVRAEVVVDKDSPTRLDGNNVESEQELVDLSKNALMYQTLTKAAASKAGLLRAAIMGRGGV